VFSSSISALISLALNLVIVFVAMVINHVDIMASILYFPLILLEIYIFGLGISLFLSAAFVKYRDISYIWEVLLQIGFYATPILYAMSQIPERFQKIQLLNPMAQAIQDARYALVSHDPHVVTIWRVFNGGWYVLIPFMIVGLVLFWGVYYFKKESKFFAENI
jgi:ABC-2 type transport system permease protein